MQPARFAWVAALSKLGSLTELLSPAHSCGKHLELNVRRLGVQLYHAARDTSVYGALQSSVTAHETPTARKGICSQRGDMLFLINSSYVWPRPGLAVHTRAYSGMPQPNRVPSGQGSGWSLKEVFTIANNLSFARLLSGPLLAHWIVEDQWGLALSGLVLAGVNVRRRVRHLE